MNSKELRQEAARIRGRARELRREFKRHSEEPAWDVVEAQLVEPLARLEQAIREERLRHEGEDPLAPVDRDPVVRGYEDRVRDYYEALAEGT